MCCTLYIEIVFIEHTIWDILITEKEEKITSYELYASHTYNFSQRVWLTISVGCRALNVDIHYYYEYNSKVETNLLFSNRSQIKVLCRLCFFHHLFFNCLLAGVGSSSFITWNDAWPYVHPSVSFLLCMLYAVFFLFLLCVVGVFATNCSLLILNVIMWNRHNRELRIALIHLSLIYCL